MDSYKLLLSEANDILKPIGFKKKGDNFFLKQEKNVGIIDFQKSNNSAASSVIFTINLGVYSGSLSVFDRIGLVSNPTISDCHWRQRIGFLLPQKQDFWWQIDDKISFAHLKSEVITILKEIAVPEIVKHLTDDDLEKYWMAGVSAGLSQQQMYLYLIALLKFNNKDGLEAKIRELKEFSKGKSFENNINENLIKVGIKND